VEVEKSERLFRGKGRDGKGIERKRIVDRRRSVGEYKEGSRSGRKNPRGNGEEKEENTTERRLSRKRHSEGRKCMTWKHSYHKGSERGLRKERQISRKES